MPLRLALQEVEMHHSNFPESDFYQLIGAFEAISKEPSQFRRRFWLVSIAGYFGIPKAEFRKLFEIWLLEQGGKA